MYNIHVVLFMSLSVLLTKYDLLGLNSTTCFYLFSRKLPKTVAKPLVICNFSKHVGSTQHHFWFSFVQEVLETRSISYTYQVAGKINFYLPQQNFKNTVDRENNKIILFNIFFSSPWTTYLSSLEVWTSCGPLYYGLSIVLIVKEVKTFFYCSLRDTIQSFMDIRLICCCFCQNICFLRQIYLNNFVFNPKPL